MWVTSHLNMDEMLSLLLICASLVLARQKIVLWCFESTFVSRLCCKLHILCLNPAHTCIVRFVSLGIYQLAQTSQIWPVLMQKNSNERKLFFVVCNLKCVLYILVCSFIIYTQIIESIYQWQTLLLQRIQGSLYHLSPYSDISHKEVRRNSLYWIFLSVSGLRVCYMVGCSL